jgi:alkylation response protein AidB-like acyl-CoA dehydrogenase
MTIDAQHSTGEAELEAFRAEVVAWLEANLEGVGSPPDGNNTSVAEFERNADFWRRLAQQGWYAPGWPVEYGGGGLPRAKVAVIQEELIQRVPAFHNVRLPGDIGGGVAGPVWVFGTDEQKRRFLPPILRAEVVSWELFTEPEAGSDLPSLKALAVRQGDEYVINGTKTFVGGNFGADQYFVLALTDPNGKRHQNLSAFIVPSNLPGLTVMPMEMIAGHKKNTITLDNVVVPAMNRIGEEGAGWRCFMLGTEFGPVGVPASGERTLFVLDMLLEHARTTTRRGTRLIDRPRERAALTKAWMHGQVDRLMVERGHALRMSPEGGTPARSRERPSTFYGAQAALHRKLYALTLSEAVMKVMGPLATIEDTRWAPYDGELEYFQRQAIVNTHPGGTCETQKTLMFRGMASSRPNLVETVARR